MPFKIIFRVFALLAFVFVTVEPALAQFKVNSVRGSGGLGKTQVRDRILQISAILNNPGTGVLGSKQLQSVGLNLDAFGGFPLTQHELGYIQNALNGANIGETTASFQNALDSMVADDPMICPTADCSVAAADWTHEQVLAGSQPWSNITPQLIDDLIGRDDYTATVLGSGGVSISTVYNNYSFQLIQNSPLSRTPTTGMVAAVENLLLEVSGFLGLVASNPDNPTAADYSAAQALVLVFLVNADRERFTQADFVACYNNTEIARSGGAGVCTVTASQWAANSSELTYFAEAKAVLRQSVLVTEAQLRNIGLDLSALPSPVPSHALAYLSNSLLDAEAASPDIWQMAINGYDARQNAWWVIDELAMGNNASGNLALDSAILAAAGLAPELAPIVSANLASLMSGITSSGLTAQSSDDALNNWVVEVAGFGTGQGSAVALALGNGWSVADWLGASMLMGWTASAADSIAFADCRASSDALTGGSNSCTLSLNGWNGVGALAAASSPTDLTDDALEAIIEATSTSDGDNAFGDLADLQDFEVGFIQDCLGTTLTASQVETCVNSATPETVATQKLTGIINGDYSGTPTVADFDRAGIGTVDTAVGDENVMTFLNADYCGAEADESCSAALAADYTDASIITGADSGSTAQDELLDYLQDALITYTEALVDSASGAVASDNQNSCGEVSLPTPRLCSNPIYDCSTGEGWAFNESRTLVSKSVDLIDGEVSAPVTFSRQPWWSAEIYTRTVRSSGILVDGGVNLITKHYHIERRYCEALNACFNRGGRMLSVGNYVTGYAVNQDPDFVLPYGDVNFDRDMWNSLTVGEVFGAFHRVHPSASAPLIRNESIAEVTAAEETDYFCCTRDNICRAPVAEFVPGFLCIARGCAG